MRKRLALLILAALPASSQEVSGGMATTRKLSFVIPNLYGPGGLTLPSADHFAHFDSAFQSNFVPLNSSIASQLTALPIPSPASGFTYSFDKTAGVYTRSADSLGPILAERAETLGKGRFFFGFGYQHFHFDSLDDVALRRVPSVFSHAPGADAIRTRDVITTNSFLDLSIGQAISFFTYGLTDRTDISVAVPLVTASFTAVSNAKIRRIGTGADTTVHFFANAVGDRSEAQFSGGGEASGLGDVVLRLKQSVLRRGRTGLAVGLDVRAPTGDEYNFLGSGATGIKPFAAVSWHLGKFAPHINAGWQWNGKSVLGGDVIRGEKRKLPSQASFAVGCDIGVSSRMTLAFDWLGQRLFDAGRVTARTFTAANGERFPEVAFTKASLTQSAGSAGLKLNAVGRLNVTFNLLFPMNHAGLRSRVTPLVGLSYVFSE